VLERAAAAAAAALSRTRGRASAPAPDDGAAIEVLITADAPPEARRHAARVLGLPEAGLVRAVATAGSAPRIEPATPVPGQSADAGANRPRTGIGPAVPLLGLPASWAAARTALRLTAEGTDDDPGPRTVYAEKLGGAALLAESIGPGTPLIPDELALGQAAAAAPWMLSTLHAVATSGSLRAAAAALPVHHSTLQDRIVAAERLLGWSIRVPEGQLRLQLALILRRLRRPPAGGEGGRPTAG